MIYLDTSWLVKLYVEESDSATIRALVDAEPLVIVSDMAFVEVHSAVLRRKRERRITARAAASVLAGFKKDWPQRYRVALSSDVLSRAAEVLAAHPLRTLDAVQLASALLVADGAPELPRFGAADARLVAAAAASGLPVLSTTA